MIQVALLLAQEVFFCLLWCQRHCEDGKAFHQQPFNQHTLTSTGSTGSTSSVSEGSITRL